MSRHVLGTIVTRGVQWVDGTGSRETKKPRVARKGNAGLFYGVRRTGNEDYSPSAGSSFCFFDFLLEPPPSPTVIVIVSGIGLANERST